MMAAKQNQLPRKPLSPRDFRSYVLELYHNCVNSLRTQNAESVAVAGVTTFESRPSVDLFCGNVQILEAACRGYDIIDDKYSRPTEFGKEVRTIQDLGDSILAKEDYPFAYFLEMFSRLTALLKRAQYFSETTVDLGRV